MPPPKLTPMGEEVSGAGFLENVDGLAGHEPLAVFSRSPLAEGAHEAIAQSRVRVRTSRPSLSSARSAERPTIPGRYARQWACPRRSSHHGLQQGALAGLGPGTTVGH